MFQMLTEREVIMRLEPHPLQPPVWRDKERGEEEKVSKRWYLVVIGLLYIGLIISFCLNITLLLRRPAQVQQLQQIQGAVCKWEN